MLSLPVHVNIKNLDNRSADVTICYSMNDKEPNAKSNDRKFYKKSLKPGDVFKSHYQNVVPDLAKYPNSVYISIQSVAGFNCRPPTK